MRTTGGPREAGPKPFSRLGVWRWEWSRSDLRGTRAARREALGCSDRVVTGHRGDSPPRPSRRSPKGGAAHPQRTFCLSFLWLSVSSKGASSSIMSPQRSFPGIIRRSRLLLGTVATTTYRQRQRERKRGQGGRPARALRHFRDTHRPAGENNPGYSRFKRFPCDTVSQPVKASLLDWSTLVLK